MRTLSLEIGTDGIALITIDLPDRPFNVFTPEFIEDLAAAVETVIASDAIKGAVITSGKTNFLAGADLKEIAQACELTQTTAQAPDRFKAERATMRRMETGGKPFAAAINGLALGGGLELCLACHYRVISDDPRTVVGLPEVTVGLLPGGGGTQRLPRMLGIEKALPLLLNGTSIMPAQAKDLGIVDASVPAADLIATARRWVLENPAAQQPWDRKGYRLPGGAGALAAHANGSFSVGMAAIRSRTQGNYPAPLAILSAVYEGTQLPIDRGLQVEGKYFETLIRNPVARNLIRTMFINKRMCDKLGGRPRDIPKSAVRKLGVIGAGMMGAGIAYAAAGVGIDVVLLDATQEKAEKGRDYSSAIVAKEIEKNRFTREQGASLLGRICATTDYALLADCDLVIEAVFENRAIKAEVIGNIDMVLKASAVIASNTSTLPITGLAQNARRAGQFIGLHFFSPVERMPLVEIIVGKETSPETLARSMDFVGQLRKTPIVVQDSPGFYTSRVFCTYVDEGMAMLEEGVNPALIENAARMCGMATGPLAVLDEVSLDLQKKVIDQAIADGLPNKFLRVHAQNVVLKMNEIGRLGRKSGGGFYDFPVGEKKHLWPGLHQIYPIKTEQPSLDEVRNRLMYIQALETARCIEEGLITLPMHADLGSILGLGFPTWSGGALSFIETVGLQKFVEECRHLAARIGPRFAPSEWLAERARGGQSFYPAASGTNLAGMNNA
ncbi:3-hydroxyacyl-CoA dehydrogenase NAD-binding domain-containing protein [Noviherbaspirillum sedimenti]|uniref:3-hydroxyacyl-CoA dehydrogenase n=1 Tax=Noviherbaspirillum sedimenti TaxID=2320865 RepID=A0A3A3FZL6_9BURK|nr:3-hydroxyacyl-CoA dehydrogenase NAD-binding domain-containing protein [Noviherbaspirillum sedimenti]RJG00825.1 3-hydroxyacyl-CoA dehydrogenase [Noviherbaspirillum sedimenti]